MIYFSRSGIGTGVLVAVGLSVAGGMGVEVSTGNVAMIGCAVDDEHAVRSRTRRRMIWRMELF